MSRTISRLGISLVGGTLVSFAMFACSSSKSNTTTPDSGTGAKTSTGGTSGSGGASGGAAGSTGGTVASTGGTSSGSDAGPYACEALPKLDPGGTGVENSACCSTIIGKVGQCVTPANVTGNAGLKAALGHDVCSPNLVCEPTASAIGDAGKFGVYDHCTASLGGGQALEGRCLPKCFVLGNPQASLLKNDGCGPGDAGAADLVCAPCFNPIDGSDTGACTQGTDAPTQPAPARYKNCGEGDGSPVGGGLCVPTAVANASGNSQVSKLKQHNCAANELCVPTVKANNVNACFAKCQVNATVASVAQSPDGACVPTFVVADSEPSGLALLDRGVGSTCAVGELCAPCTDPLAAVAGTPSGACE